MRCDMVCSCTNTHPNAVSSCFSRAQIVLCAVAHDSDCEQWAVKPLYGNLQVGCTLKSCLLWSEIAAEAFYSVICAVAYYLLFYFPIGFQRSPSRAGYQFLIILVLEFFSVTLGQAVAALSPSILTAAYCNPVRV